MRITILTFISIWLVIGVCHAGEMVRANDGTYVEVPDGGQVVRAPDGTYVATDSSGMTERAPDGSWHGELQ